MKPTAEALTFLECLCKLRSHFYEEVLAPLKLAFSRRHCLVDHLLNANLVSSIENVADPLLVQVVPINLIRETFHESGLCAGMIQEVFNG